MSHLRNGGVQLPDDVVSVRYRQVRPFDYRQVFSSPSNGFTGTEEEFIAAGLAYRFVQLDKHTRLTPDYVSLFQLKRTADYVTC